MSHRCTWSWKDNTGVITLLMPLLLLFARALLKEARFYSEESHSIHLVRQSLQFIYVLVITTHKSYTVLFGTHSIESHKKNHTA